VYRSREDIKSNAKARRVGVCAGYACVAASWIGGALGSAEVQSTSVADCEEEVVREGDNRKRDGKQKTE